MKPSGNRSQLRQNDRGASYRREDNSDTLTRLPCTMLSKLLYLYIAVGGRKGTHRGVGQDAPSALRYLLSPRTDGGVREGPILHPLTSPHTGAVRPPLARGGPNFARSPKVVIWSVFPQTWVVLHEADASQAVCQGDRGF